MNVKIPFYKKAFSFFWPIILQRESSAVNPILEITVEYGKLVLNTKNANYSHGSLHKVMDKALSIAKKEYNCSMENVLLLGYGGGSASDLLRRRYNYNANITAIEIDEKIIEIAKKWFPVENVLFKQGNADTMILQLNEKYELILCDLFIDTSMPGFSIQSDFYNAAKDRLKNKGVFVQNLMTNSENITDQMQVIGKSFSNVGMVHVFGTNWLLFGTM